MQTKTIRSQPEIDKIEIRIFESKLLSSRTSLYHRAYESIENFKFKTLNSKATGDSAADPNICPTDGLIWDGFWCKLIELANDCRRI